MHTNHFMQAVKTLKLELCRAHTPHTLQLHDFLTAWNRSSTCKFYDMVTITYNEHAQLKQYMHKHGLPRCGQYAWPNKSTICSACGCYEVLWSQVLPLFCQFWHRDSTGHSLRCLDTQIRWFFVDNEDRTDYFTPLAHAHGVNMPCTPKICQFWLK